MIIPSSQARMSIPNIVGGVILLIALFIVIILCLFNLRYYIREGNPSSERRASWRNWFAFHDQSYVIQSEKASKFTRRSFKRQNMRLTSLPHPRSKNRHRPSVEKPLVLPLPLHSPSNIHAPIELPPIATMVNPYLTNNLNASRAAALPLPLHHEKEVTFTPPPTRAPSPVFHTLHRKRHTSSFEAATGIGMGPSYRPPSPSPLRDQPPIDPEIRSSISIEFSHYFNPFAWMAAGAHEGVDLDSGLENGKQGG
ncbi:hypothetical protein M408DRAFT_333322 [Serendipita vermifera MAFF 305830]|uniref:Uncharacterized protein n=1 Tax=Serendipita vermifera MAFF 305830 TaxID=933852 RepID=A0A0C3AR28_SERVB|nr:hypothetical protein M408DRAFT_333322 [Serendipita vermifera MAFF 305830]